MSQSLSPAMAARSTAEGASPSSSQPPKGSHEASNHNSTAAVAAPHITCFACSRCEYPICDSSALLLRTVQQGTSDYAFQYNLDGLLDLGDRAVPCYSAAEVVHTSVVVSEALMAVPLPPVAQVMVLESIVQSRKHWIQQRHSMNARMHEHGVGAHSTSAATPPTAAAGASEETPPSSTSRIADSSPPIVRRYGDAAESRIDLVCVSDSVLGTGVEECTQDRSAAATRLESEDATTSAHSCTSGEGDGRGSASAAAAVDPTVVRDASFAHVPPEVLAAATAEAAETRWSSPGNMVVREAFMDVNRATLSSRAPWFQDFRCARRVQCPDCHQALGFVFCAAETVKGVKRPAVEGEADDPSPHAERLSRGEEEEDGNDDDDDSSSDETGTSRNGHEDAETARLPHAKKTRNENDAPPTVRQGVQEAVAVSQQLRSDDDADVSASAAALAAEADVSSPPRFVGLELKKVVQRNWDLHAFQARYNKARDVAAFRSLFPEAEELQSLYSRLLGLRTQTELYSSLLRRHKEQNDVQMALLSSNKERMHTYDEKVRTMQQIIEAQRAQIEMQTRQIRNQEELVQSHRRQFATQQRQMEVEQLLFAQQNKTIESQKEQIRLLKTHFELTRPEVLRAAQLGSSPPGAAALQQQQQQREDDTQAEEDWADVDDDDEGDEGDRHSTDGELMADGGTERSAGAHRGTPPVHLCGVATAAVFPSKAPSAAPAKELPDRQLPE